MCKINFRLHNACLYILCAKKINFEKFRLEGSMRYLTILRFPARRKWAQFSVTRCSVRNLTLTDFCYVVQNIRKQHTVSRIPFIRKPVNDIQRNALSHKSLIKSLENCNSVAEQIKVFHSSVKLTGEDINIRQTVCQDVEKILKLYFSSCFVRLVGSSINGLGLKGCDVDLSLRFSNGQNDQNLSSYNAPALESILKLKLPADKFYNSLPKNQLLTIRKVLENLNFKEPTVIPGRCPILSFHLHNLSCDLSINNSSAVHGTNLMLLCGKLDERVPPLMQTINYWAKHSKLIGAPSKFKSYALFLLVIYFLQTRNPPVLPAIETIFEKSDFLKNFERSCYDIGKYSDVFELSSNSQPIDELLREFFFFYGNFDFSCVICPISSTAVNKKKFTLQNDCTNDFELKSSICIQDPIDLSWNVTSGVTWKNCAKFSKALISVCEKYQNPNYWIPGSQNWGLSSVLDSEFSYNNLKDIKEFSLNIPLIPNITSTFLHSDIEYTFRKAASYVKYILSHCLLFQCKLISSFDGFNSLELPQSVKTVIVNDLLNDNSFNYLAEKDSILNKDNLKGIQNSHFVAHFICSTKNTWSGRNAFMSAFREAKDVFDKEHLISNQLDEERRNNEKEIFYFLCECCEVNFENNISLNIKFKPLNSDRFIPLLVIFLKEYIPWLMNKLLFDSHIEKEEIVLT